MPATPGVHPSGAREPAGHARPIIKRGNALLLAAGCSTDGRIGRARICPVPGSPPGVLALSSGHCRWGPGAGPTCCCRWQRTALCGCGTSWQRSASLSAALLIPAPSASRCLILLPHRLPNAPPEPPPEPPLSNAPHKPPPQPPPEPPLPQSPPCHCRRRFRSMMGHDARGAAHPAHEAWHMWRNARGARHT